MKPRVTDEHYNPWLRQPPRSSSVPFRRRFGSALHHSTGLLRPEDAAGGRGTMVVQHPSLDAELEVWEELRVL